MRSMALIMALCLGLLVAALPPGADAASGTDTGRDVQLQGKIVNKGGGFVLMTQQGQDYELQGAKEDLSRLDSTFARVSGSVKEGSALTGAQPTLNVSSIQPMERPAAMGGSEAGQ